VINTPYHIVDSIDLAGFTHEVIDFVYLSAGVPPVILNARANNFELDTPMLCYVPRLLGVP